jgi:signal peptidase I
VTHNASGVYDALGLTPDSVTGNYHPLYLAPLTNEMIEALRKLKNVAEIIPVPADFFGKDYVYPLSETNPWTRADYGPIWIPKAGQSIALTPDNVALYERCIRNYEGNTLEVTPEGGYLLNGTPADRYTFRMDYYWMMGDNRDNSADSRYWGFVPEDHIVGTPLFVWFSVDKETGKWRWDRIFKKVHGL